MKRNVTLRWLSVMFMTISAVLCRANWVVETEEVDASPGAGLFNAVALDEAGTPMIAYYEATNAVLKGAALDETRMWQTMLLDDNGDVGQHCSDAVDGDGVAHVSYQYRYPFFGQTRGDLKYKAGTNAPVTLDNALGRMGEGTSLALDTAGNVHIAYQAVTLSGNFLKYIARTNGVWSVPQVVEDGGSGVSMALDSSGRPHIAHRDGTDVRYVVWSGGGWTSEVVEGYDVLAGRTAIALDSAGQPHIVFSTTDGLMYARHDGSGWNQECVHYTPVMGEVGLDSPSLTLDEDDEPFISYQGRFGAPAAVVVSRRVYNEGEETWEWLAEAWLQEGGGLGGQTAIAVDGRGVFHVAFHDAAADTLGYASVAEDTDEDWLPDWWELEYFENLDQGAEDDPDEDDLTNNDEYWGGTDPTVPDEGGGEEDSDGDGLYDEDETFLGTDPYDPDTDGDGLPDGWEFWSNLDPLSDVGDDGASGNPDGDAFTNLQEYEYGLDPQNYGDGDPDEDMDWDYLTNAQEAALGTHPLERDTDGDGLMDGGDAGDPGESQYGTDPLDPDSDDDGLLDGVEVGYYVFWDSFEEPEVDEHWTLGGDAAWQIDEAEVASGNGAQSARSGAIVDNQSCWLEMEAVLLGRGTLSFYYKTSCEADGDFLILSTNGAEYARYSGETDWTEDYVYLPAGTNILRWIYEKNVAGSNGTDTVWIDLVDLRVPTTGSDPNDADSDDDGLEDGEEINQYGTYPQFADSDYDGLDDWDEIFVHGTDPLDWDSDDDGLEDGYEEDTLGTDPLDPDSDDDGIPDGVEVGAGLNPLLDDAGQDADSDGLTNLQEHLLGTKIADADTDNDGMPDGWEVDNGLNPLLYDATLDADEDDLSNHGEWQAGTDPNDPDSDDDGLTDGWEVANGLNPLLDDAADDPDADGLTNTREHAEGTDPLDDDSDGDGLLDGAEVDTHGTNPLDADSDHDTMPDLWEVTNGLNPTANDSGGDPDGDALGNAREYTLGTDPQDADSDDDGLSDGAEVDSHGTNPLDADSDGDGMPDGWEVANGLNPLLDDAAGDPDVDGLANGREHTEGTDPQDADSDDDGLLDGAEVDTHGTNPMADGSDDDGMPDGWEVANGLNPLLDDADSDPDDDSLTNEREYTRGTDPQDADSDDDGLLDGAEVDTHGTNPLDEDSDGDCMPDGWEMLFSLDPLDDDTAGDPDADGLTNVQEYTLGTDPRNADSDADGMPDGWEVAHDLNPLADDSGADPDADGLTNAREYTRGTDPQDTDSDNDGLSDGAEVDVRGTDPLDADSDNDGLSDGVEVNTHGTDPLDADTDNDGLSDGAEVATHGTNPLNADTDGDGMPDGWELANGLNPLVDDADDDADGDGLTNLEEYTHGASAQSADGDSDGLSDWDEIYVYGTNPTDADSDDDGLVDGHETGWGPALEEYFTDGVLPSGWTTSGNSTWTVVDEENYGFGHKAAKSGATGTSWLSRTVEIPQPAWLSFAVRVNTWFDDGLLRFKINGQTVAQWSMETPWPMVDSFSQELQPGVYELKWEYQVGIVYGEDDAAWLDDVMIQSNVDYGTDPQDADSDDDGLTDGDEVAIYQTSPSQADSDFDGISDYDELFVEGTDPMDADTDGDGLTDGAEVNTHFTDPLDSDTDGDDLSDGAEVNTHSTDPLDADSDDDGMPDGWEVAAALDPNLDDGAGDADSDDLCNLDEYTRGTDPTCMDSDGDGMYDGEEVHDYGCDPLDADSDGDGVEDGAEATGVGWTLESFEAGVLPAGWTTGGDASWFVQQGEAGHGDYALRSPVIGPSQSAWLELTFYAGPREVSWLYNKTVSASPYLTCTFDGQPVWQGETGGWYGYNVSSTTGVHTLRWEYTKGPGAPYGDDVFLLDRFWMPNPPLGTDPLDPDTDGDGLSDGRETLEEVLDESESFEPPPAPLMMLGAGLLATTGEGAWASSGDAPWTTDTATAYDGIASKRSGTIGDGQQSVLTYTVTTEKGRVSFWYRVSSETAKDGLVFSIDGEPATNWSGSIGWAQASFPVSAGPHVFSWTYVKDAGGAAGDDAAWVDLVERTAGGTGTDPLNADTDDDGMPDGWEVDMGFEPTSGADGDADADGDLLTNAGEYENQTDPFKQDTDGDGQNDYEEVVVTGMDPLDPLSLLKFESLSPVAGGFELKWLSAAGKVYGILTTTNLAAGYEPLQTGITAGSGGRTVFTNAPASGTRFYRVRVTAP